MVLLVEVLDGTVMLDNLARGLWMSTDKGFADYQWIDREAPGSRDWVSPARPPALEDLARRSAQAVSD